MDNTPFIHKFLVDKNKHFVYCVNTNRLMNVSNIVYDVIDYMWQNNIDKIFNTFKNKYDAKDVQSSLNELHKLNTEIGFASYKRPKYVESKNNLEEYKYVKNCKMAGIILNVTNDCNMSCTYCVYGNLFHKRRKLTLPYMKMEIAKQSINFLFDHSSESNKIGIKFYGGEPLLNFNLIKETVEYARNQNNGRKELGFKILSNGTLLNYDIIRWLIENNIGLVVSIDGPKRIHNRYRKFKNGKGTYDIIYNNLKLIKEINEDYFKQKIFIHMVGVPPLNIKNIFNYCCNDPLKSNFSLYSLRFDSKGYFKNIIDADFDSYKAQLKIILENYFKNLNNFSNCFSDVNLIQSSLYNYGLSNIVLRKQSIECDNSIEIQVCKESEKQCFVSTSGIIYPCEKVDQYTYLEIGNVFNGFYKSSTHIDKGFNTITDFLNVIGNKCCNCWCYRFCCNNNCFITAHGMKGFSQKKMQKNCSIFQKELDLRFKVFMSLKKYYAKLIH